MEQNAIDSIEALVEGGISELQTLADTGNPLAKQWAEDIKSQPDAMGKLSRFGEMRLNLIALLASPVLGKKARQVYETMFPESER